MGQFLSVEVSAAQKQGIEVMMLGNACCLSAP